MQEVDINTLVNENHILNKNIPNDIIIIGKIDIITIEYKYNKLNLFLKNLLDKEELKIVKNSIIIKGS